MSLKKQAITPQFLIPIFISTYQGQSTQQVDEAFNILKGISTQFFGPFLNSCEEILQRSCHQNKQLCQSISNFIKILTKIMVDQNRIYESGPKDFINKIQHIFDNTKIPFEYKQNIAMSYIKAALHFNINFQKITQKISYLYRTKEPSHALLLSRAYISCDYKFNHKAQGYYYKKILQLQLKQLSSAVNSFKNQNNIHNQDHDITRIIYEILKNLHTSLVFIPFQKFESSIYSCLEKNQIIDIIYSLQILQDKKHVAVILREIIQKLIQNLHRMKRMEQIPKLMDTLRYRMHEEWNKYQSLILQKRSCLQSSNNARQIEFNLEDEISRAKLLTASFTSNIILILDNNFDFVNLLIIPLFQLRSYLFKQKSDQSPKEIQLTIEDVCFDMKSQSLEVEFNKMLKSILSNYQTVHTKVFSLLDNHLLSTNNDLDTIHENQDSFQRVLMLMNLLSLQSSYFMTNDSIIQKTENFLKSNQKILFNSQNSQLYFHSLLLLWNYQDDMFCEDDYSCIYTFITKNLIQSRLLKYQNSKKQSQNSYFFFQQQQSHQLNLINHYQKQILKQFYEAGFPHQLVKNQYQLIIQYLRQQYDPVLMSIFIGIIKNYHIEDKIALDIFDKMLESVIEYINTAKLNQMQFVRNVSTFYFVKFLETFFDIQSYKHLFESTLSRCLPIFETLISSAGDQYIDEFFTLIKNFAKNLEYIPTNYFSWMMNIFKEQKLQTQSSYLCLVQVLKHAKKSAHHSNQIKSTQTFSYELFINCLTLQLTEILSKFKMQKQVDIKSLKQSHHNNSYSLSPSSSSHQKQFFSTSQNRGTINRQIYTLLTFHQLIYYHGEFLTRKVLKHVVQIVLHKIIPQKIKNDHQSFDYIKNQVNSFSFVKGKYQLIMILLFRKRLFDVNQILYQLDIQKATYNSVYMQQNNYLIQYDSPIFIKQQLFILKHYINTDKLQLQYANTSFLALFYKFFIIYSISNPDSDLSQSFDYPDLQSSDSDQQQIQPSHQFKSKYKEIIKLVENFPKPKEWMQINYLKEVTDFLMELSLNQKSKQWLGILCEKCMHSRQKKLVERLMQGDFENVKGKCRQIRKVNRKVNNNVNNENSSGKKQNKDIQI